MTGKVWTKYTPEEPEVLLMDMSLSIGDTFTVLARTYISDTIHMTVDSVFYTDGMKNIRLNFKIYNAHLVEDYLIFQEGIGPNTGLSYLKPGPNYYQLPRKNEHILCYTRDDTTRHMIEIYEEEGCNIFGTNTNDLDRITNAAIYPNPARENLTIEI